MTGFTDIHCHGGGGYSFSDSNPEYVQRAINTHRSFGTTIQIASLVTEPLETLKKQIKNLLPFVTNGELAGIHLEGPYLSRAHCGAHNPDFLRYPSLDEIKSLIESGSGAIKMITLAPELPGAMEAIQWLKGNGITVAIGHSQPTYDQGLEVIDSGATLVTHMFNGMPRLDHRQANITNAVLNDSNIFFELILDGIHVHQSMVQLLLAIAPERVILVTDDMSGAGAPDDIYKLGDLDLEVKDGAARLLSNNSLAGSTLTMDMAYRLLLEEFQVDPSIALSAATTLALKLLGI
jgi:N-acetylglucosamine-6-phosphate deacetylase